ncbi:hypothetical protein FQN54_006529 [Arachnomyces sp. PD_36]|nr:hypothetical protein FQN54_006529 [Arachnomyces sp. PD_36]
MHHLSRCFFLATFLQGLVLVTAAPYPFGAVRNDYTNVGIRAVDIITELGPQLSPNASIITQSDPEFEGLSPRYSTLQAPAFTAIVNPGCESDVAITVRYANRVNLPFLAVNRGHGSTVTQGQLQHGLRINMGTLMEYEIDEGTESVRLQGGVWTEGIVGPLWDAGYVTTTGGCGCVGLVGPGLGGGYGRYMGFYGLVLDSFIEMNMVLADGSEVVVSPNSYPDLWWAVRGAGHNFGIVTSFRKEIHRKTVESWYYATYIYTQDKLEAFISAVNEQIENGRQPKEVVISVTYAWYPSASTTDPVVILGFQYAGTKSEAEPFYAPFDALEPASREEGDAPYPELAGRTGSSSADPVCQTGSRHVQAPQGLLLYNTTTEREVFEYYKATTLQEPRFNQSAVVLANFAVAQMQAIPEEDSAFPHRADNILAAINVMYPDDPTLDDAAIEFGKNTRQIWANGKADRRSTAYVNYAYGDEGMEEIYGYEPWRLERLRAAKRKYDPDNRFSFYNPITF